MEDYGRPESGQWDFAQRKKAWGGGGGGVGQPIFFAFPFQYNIINVSGLGTG